jgi:hypothetical protein
LLLFHLPPCVPVTALLLVLARCSAGVLPRWNCAFWLPWTLGTEVLPSAGLALMHDILDVNDLAVFQTKDVANMIKLWNQDAANNNSKLGMGIQKKVEALIWWAANQHRHNLLIDMTMWTVQALMSALQGMAIHNNTKAQLVPSELEPGKVETELNWYTWDEKFENYLAAHIGSATVPLDCVVRRNKDDDWDPEGDAATEHERQRYQMVLDGPEFTHDDKVEHLKLKGFCLDTLAWEWI